MCLFMIILWFWLVIILRGKEALTAGYRDHIVMAACCVKKHIFHNQNHNFFIKHNGFLDCSDF